VKNEFAQKPPNIALVRLVFRIQSFDLIGEQTKCLKIKQSNINEVLFSLEFFVV